LHSAVSLTDILLYFLNVIMYFQQVFGIYCRGILGHLVSIYGNTGTKFATLQRRHLFALLC